MDTIEQRFILSMKIVIFDCFLFGDGEVYQLTAPNETLEHIQNDVIVF